MVTTPELATASHEQQQYVDADTKITEIVTPNRSAFRRSKAFRAMRRLAVVACLAFSGNVAVAEAGDTYQQIPNWAGYEYDGNPSNFDYVTTDFIVPSVTCPSSGSENADIWAGIGGGSHTTDTLYQTGIKIDCNDGTSSYSAFWQEVPGISPEQSFTYSHTITPGDKMIAQVIPNSDGVELTLQDYGSDLSQYYPNWTDTEQIYETPPSSIGSAECIVERRTTDDEGDLADFADVGTVYFSTDTSGSFAKACDVTSNDNDHIISSSGLSWSGIYRDEMYSFYEGSPVDLLASTTGQSSSGSFQVEWQNYN